MSRFRQPAQCLPAGALACLSALLLGACASNPAVETRAQQQDPWEAFNRKTFAFNRGVDRVALKPLAKGYRAVMPEFAMRGVGNFFDNLSTPRSALNNLLQGKPGRSLSELGRFVFNTTLGVAGLFDVTGHSGIPRYPEDFAQTLAVWGLPSGPYVVMPIWGPQTLSDSVALPFDYYADLRVHIGDIGTKDKLNVIRLIDVRSRLLSADSLLDSSQDPYITFRESYLQNRNFRVHDGDPPVEEELYEFFDDEEFAEPL